MGQSRATLKDVALRSGYALRTVKKVMGGKERVGSKTRIAVMRAAEELNYQRNIIASALSKSKITRIAIAYAEVSEAYFPEVQKGFVQCADEFRDFGISVEFNKIFNLDMEAQVAAVKEITADESIGGLIIQPISSSGLNPYIDAFAQSGRPVITFGADAPLSKRLSYIGPDAYKSGRIGAQILANYIGKCGNVAVISDNNEHMQTVERIRGFRDRVEEHYPQLRITNINIPLLNIKLYHEIVRTLVCNESIQGIFCTDANSYIVGQVLCDLGRNDVVVVGFDVSEIGSELMKQGHIKVLIDQNPFNLAHMSLKTMFNIIYMEEKPELLQHTPLSILTSECLDS